MTADVPLSPHPDLDQLRALCPGHPDNQWYERRTIALRASTLLALIDELEAARNHNRDETRP